MLTSFISSASILAVRQPGVIVGPIANLLGFIYNILFNFIYGIMQTGSLGIAIILFTLFVKIVLLPLSFKQQKSTFKMQKLQPELNKIRAKYANKKDQESQQRMAYEMQEFQKKNGMSMFGGCLPLLVQLPILYALFYIFQQAYLYVDVINGNYTEIANALLAIEPGLRMQAIGGFAAELADSLKIQMDMSQLPDVLQVVNTLSRVQWNTVLETLGDAGASITPLLAQKHSVEYFLGINLVSNAGWGFPGIVIPVLAGLSTWLSSKVMMKMQAQSQASNDPTASTMKMMNIIMPVMMGFMSVSLPAALGLYWTISNLFQLFQQWGLQKYFRAKDEKEGAV